MAAIIACYVRSSSWNALEFCENQHFLSYICGFPSPSNKAAAKGNVVHKAMEFLAYKKLADQNGEMKFDVPELGSYDASFPQTYEQVLDLAYDYYSKTENHLVWKDTDYKDCLKWFKKAREFNEGKFNPVNQEIFSVEQFFDIEIVKPWAFYKFWANDQQNEGFLRLRGSIDLITQVNEKTLEIIDYKTGRKYNWAKEKDKTYNDIKNDIQLRLYFYAVRKLFPQFPYVMITLFYINADGATTICYDDKDLEKTEEMVKDYFERVSKIKQPRLTKTWKCEKLCPHSKVYKDTGVSICEFMQEKVRQLGLIPAMELYADSPNYLQYGAGGGKRNDNKTTNPNQQTD